jgi:hypothetical protein
VVDAGKSKIPNGKGKERNKQIGGGNMGRNKECKKCTKNRGESKRGRETAQGDRDPRK